MLVRNRFIFDKDWPMSNGACKDKEYAPLAHRRRPSWGKKGIFSNEIYTDYNERYGTNYSLSTAKDFKDNI